MFKKFAVNTFFYGFSQIVRSFVPFIMIPILTSYLSVREYGILSLIEVFILFLFPLVSLNVHSAVNVQFFKLKSDEYKKYFTNSLLLSFISFIVVLCVFIVLGKYFASFVKINYTLLIILPFLALLRLYPQVLLSYLQANSNAKLYFYITLGITLLDLIFSLIFIIYFDYGYKGRLLGVYSSFLIFTFIMFLFFYKKDFFKKITLKYSSQIFSYGFFLIPHALSGVTMAMSDRYFISYFYDNASVGIYTIAYQVGAILLLFTIALNKAWSVFLFKKLKKNQKIWKFVFIVYIVLLFVFFVEIISKNLLFYLLVDVKFYEAKKYFNYLLTGFLFQSFYMIITNFLFYYEKTKILSSLTLSGAIINIILNYLFIIKYGVIGVAIATMVTWIYYFIIVSLIIYFMMKGKGGSKKHKTS